LSTPNRPAIVVFSAGALAGFGNKVMPPPLEDEDDEEEDEDEDDDE